MDPRNDGDWMASADSGDEPIDPWAQGIGVFDMASLEVQDSYEANATPYEPPDNIKKWYSLQFVHVPLLINKYSRRNEKH